MRLLTKFEVGPYPVEVFETDAPIADDDPDGLYLNIMRPRRILIHSRCVGAERWAVLLHELTHLALGLHGITLTPAIEERVCDAIAMTLTEALRSTMTSDIGAIL